MKKKMLTDVEREDSQGPPGRRSRGTNFLFGSFTENPIQANIFGHQIRSPDRDTHTHTLTGAILMAEIFNQVREVVCSYAKGPETVGTSTTSTTELEGINHRRYDK